MVKETNNDNLAVIYNLARLKTLQSHSWDLLKQGNQKNPKEH